ncbi:MAG: nucleoside-diphosphate sugar epimerase/dehydratase [Desulfovibrionales bacterium]|nr:nucleoside-diphosphate sugar epimerase/dehydratase [Desulfovibrionales bacterium]
MKVLLRNKNFWVMLAGDIALLGISYVLAYALRFEFHIPQDYMVILKKSIIPVVISKLLFFYWFKLYRGMWRYTSIADLLNIIKAVSISTMVVMVSILMFHRFQGYPRSVFVIDAILTLIFISGFRLAVRLLFVTDGHSLTIIRRNGQQKGRRLLIIGAGSAGEKMLREIRDNAHLEYDVIGFLDDDSNKVGRSIHGVPVLGVIDELKEFVIKKRIEEILIAIPSATGNQMKRIVELCKQTKVKYKTIPGIGELIDGRVSVKSIRDVSYEDLLGREPVHLEKEKIGRYLQGKRILITGAGGSIGSELCRQIARYNPAHLMLLDRTEKNLYDIEMDMWRNFSYIRYIPVLGDIRHKGEIKAIFERYRPEVVFHAAAYKHVPMLELNPWEAIYNNILGSKNVIEVACDSGIERFVLVSTDKAVNPTNVMGASKRVTELLVQTHANPGLTRFMAVRFGNVVGSSGSVIPLFKKQIEQGGPVTVTHPEVTRYFMTIPEAVQLILQAGTMGKDAEVFILDMGTPVKIVDMARDLIKLSGLEPEKDIDIEFIGLRPGEKLHEELVVVGEEVAPTGHDKILVLKQNGSGLLTKNDLEKNIRELVKLADARDAAGIKQKLKEIVPEYTPQEV